ncbi:MAG: hypothetical protein ACLPXZ_26210 [Mycobacterium sp.]
MVETERTQELRKIFTGFRQAVRSILVLSALTDHIRRKEGPMRITAIAVAGLVAGTLLTASPAQAQPSFPLSPQSDAEDVRQQIADLDAAWDSLTPAQRNQRFTQIQQGLTKLDFETRNVPQDQKAGVDLILLPALGNLGSLYQRVRNGPG